MSQLLLPSMGLVETCDPNEAPAGFYAVPKSECRKDQGNLCRQCDWRATCQDPTTDFLVHGHRCMSYAITATKDGKTYQRSDKCSVVFKRLPSGRRKEGTGGNL